MRTRLPWLTFLFLLAVFIFSTPFDISYSVKEFGTDTVLELDEAIKSVEKGDLGRRIVLISLGAFALISHLHLKRKQIWINGLLGWLILFYIVWAILSIFWAYTQWLTARRVVILVLLSMGSLAVAERLSLRETAVLTLFICGITLLTSVVAVIAADTFQPFKGSWRFAGVMHPVSQGWNCGLLAIAAFALSRSSARKRAFYFSIALVALLFLVLTRSRVAFVTALLGIGVCTSLGSSKSYKLAIVLIGSVVLVCLMYLILGDEIIVYIQKAATLGRGGIIRDNLSTLTSRIPVWKECLRYVDKHPIIGYGYNYFNSPLNLKRISESVGFLAGSVHSGYIETLLGLGFVGAITLVSILILALKLATSLSRLDSYYAFVTAVLVWLSFNLVTETLLITRPIFPTFLCMIMLAKLGFVKMLLKDKVEIHDRKYTN